MTTARYESFAEKNVESRKLGKPGNLQYIALLYLSNFCRPRQRKNGCRQGRQCGRKAVT